MTELQTAAERLKGNAYPGRGIVLGRNEDGACAVTAYFLEGRSANSRNRVLTLEDGVLKTKPFDEALVSDPSLIIYNAMRVYENRLIVSNGDQTDTIREFLAAGKSFAEALKTRTFEPDAPNYTPRISGLVTIGDGSLSCEMSILRREPSGGCERAFFAFEPEPGTGMLFHTYEGDGAPLPSFEGPPRGVRICGSAEDFAHELWEALDPQNRIALFVRYTDLSGGGREDRLINKNV